MSRSSQNAPSRIVQVLVPYPVAQAYDYSVPEGMALAPGDYVRVPLGRRDTLGVVWADAGGSCVDLKKIRAVLEKLDLPPLPETARRFADWVARYTLSDAGAVLKMTVGTAMKPGPAKPRRRGAETQALTPAAVPPRVLELSESQAEAADALIQAARAGAYSTTVLDGVTGSGKTEVYFEAVAEMVRRGRQALILLPEIALSAQFLDRFRRRFGASPALWHSALTPAARRQAWRDVAAGSAPVVAGARSALFLPFSNLGLIVVDEEHDASYKQDDGVVYHARDMAVARAHLGGIPVVLASATPSLETLHNVAEGKYRRLHLPARAGGAELPTMEVIDLRAAPPARGRFLSPRLIEAVGATLARGEQALLFLNRRGYAPLTLCRGCGHRFQCPSCSAWLVRHRQGGRLQCHHCGHNETQPPACPACGAADSLVACGPGVERIEDEVRATFPEARTLLLASDAAPNAKSIAAAVRAIEERAVDIVIGTQMVAKGHHFPFLTCVGVVDADLGLAGGDPRAGERTFQLLQQVAGRAGRGERPGQAFLQSYMPGQAVIRALAAGDREGFLAAETRERQAAGLPPYGRLAALIVSAAREDRLDAFCRALARSLPRQDPGMRVLGPAVAPMAFLRGKHRRRFLIKARKDTALQALLRGWLDGVATPSGIDIKIDVDPQSFY